MSELRGFHHRLNHLERFRVHVRVVAEHLDVTSKFLQVADDDLYAVNALWVIQLVSPPSRVLVAFHRGALYQASTVCGVPEYTSNTPIHRTPYL